MAMRILVVSFLISLGLALCAWFVNLAGRLPLPAAYLLLAWLAALAALLIYPRVTPVRGRPAAARREPVAPHAKKETGNVKWFSPSKGFGFITRDNGEDIFVHFRSIMGKGHRVLREGQRVEFAVIEGNKGLQAEDVITLN